MSDTLARLSAALADRYRIGRELGAGGMARVYEAQDVRHHRKVAVKVLRAELAEALGAERFLREIETIASLRHPHILPLYDSGEASGSLFYVMPLVEGESLRARLEREKQLPLDEALRIAREVADALSYAHSRGIIHRDIKPENLLLGPDGRVRVTDFGLALALPRGFMFGGATSRSGTPQFAAPEQLVGGQVDVRSDLFSLALVGYFALLGKPPLEGRTAEGVRRGQVGGTLPSLRDVRDDVPAQLERVLKKAASMDPLGRYASATTFRTALRRAVRSSGAQPQPERRSLLGRIAGIFE